MNTGEHIWRDRVPTNFGLANLISKKLDEHEWMNPGAITNLRDAEEILLACDYGGFQKSSIYESYSFLIANITKAWNWNDARKQFRSIMLKDSRRISFKSTRGERRLTILHEFLDVANFLPGVLFCFLIDKKLGGLLSAKSNPFKFLELVSPKKGWNLRSFDRLSLIAHLGSLVIGGLSGTKQDILWVTDRDEIAPNPQKHDHAGWVLWYYLSKYAPDIDGKLVFVTSEADLGKRNLDDAISLADLSAGALSKAMSTPENQSCLETDIFLMPVDYKLEKRTRIILQWLAERGFHLSKLIVVVSYKDVNNVQIKIGGPSMFTESPMSDTLFIY